MPTSLYPSLPPSLILIPVHTPPLLSSPHQEEHELSVPDPRPGTSLICAPADAPGSKGKWCRLIVIPWRGLAFLEYLILQKFTSLLVGEVPAVNY